MGFFLQASVMEVLVGEYCSLFNLRTHFHQYNSKTYFELKCLAIACCCFFHLSYHNHQRDVSTYFEVPLFRILVNIHSFLVAMSSLINKKPCTTNQTILFTHANVTVLKPPIISWIERSGDIFFYEHFLWVLEIILCLHAIASCVVSYWLAHQPITWRSLLVHLSLI